MDNQYAVSCNVEIHIHTYIIYIYKNVFAGLFRGHQSARRVTYLTVQDLLFSDSLQSTIFNWMVYNTSLMQHLVFEFGQNLRPRVCASSPAPSNKSIPVCTSSIAQSGIPWLSQFLPSGAKCHQGGPKASKLESQGNYKRPKASKNGDRGQMK